MEPVERTLRRRDRAELETLAAEFVKAPDAQSPVSLKFAISATASTIVALGVLWWVLGGDVEPPLPRTQDSAASEATAWQQRAAAERERRRRELAAGLNYMDKLAQEERAALQAFQREEASPPAVDPDPAPRNAAAMPDLEPTSEDSTPVSAVPPASTSVAALVPATQAPASGPGTDPAKPPATTTAASAAKCSIHVSELSKSGTLTYDAVARMKGSRMDDASGHVFTAPVTVNGRSVVFEVLPDGCVRIVRSAVR